LTSHEHKRAGEILEEQVWKDFEERYNLSRFKKEPRKSIQIELPLWDWANISNGCETCAEAIAIA
jgi:hypothetical protein